MLHIPRVLGAADVDECRRTLERADTAWTDGTATAGYLSSRVKHNAQVPEDHPVARRLGERILDALDRHPLFIAAALPHKIVPPLFNRYTGGQAYGPHVDGAIRPVPGTPHRVRTDLSATLFLSDPADYEGGELVIAGTAARIKLAAGDLVVYPSTSVHHVEPVTRGTRLAAFFWIQSLVRDDGQRRLLLDLDTALQQLGRDVPDHPALVALMGTYHNLLRRWSDV